MAIDQALTSPASLVVDGNLTTTDTLTVNSGVTVIVNGYVKASAAIIASTSAPLSFTFNSGSTYEHAFAGGAIPMSTWNTGSTCLVTGTTSASPGNALQNYYNFTWNCIGQTTNLNLAWDNVVIGGDITVTNCGSTGTNYQLRMTSAATTRTISINGNVLINGGFLTASGSSGAAQYNITVKGNITVQAGTLNLCGGSGGFGTWWLWGNLTVGATGSFVAPSNKTINTRLIFAATNGAQTYTLISGGSNKNLNYGIENNTTVTLNSPLTVGNGTLGYLVLTSGKIVTTATNLLTLAANDTIKTGTGYISGPIAQTVAVATQTTLTFPLGKSVYRPVVLTLTQDAATSTVYTGEIFDAAPPANTLPSTLDAVSNARYFHFVKGAGAEVATAVIQLNYDANDGITVSNKDNIRIAKDDGAGAWVNLGGSGTADNTGNILSNSFGTTTALGKLTTNDFVVAHVNPSSVATLPTLSTDTVTYISTTFATSGGTISNDGNAAITAKGVCWNTATAPTITNNLTTDGATSAKYSSSITGLIAGTKYFVRAYATNSAGTAYGNEVSFTTLTTLSAPTVTTDSISDIVNTTATGNGKVTEWGGSAISDRGICWGTATDPTLANDYNSIGGGSTGAFTTQIGGLKLGTIYYVRAYATNSTGTGYGQSISFTTPTPQADIFKKVAQDGSGDYTNLYDAFNAVPSNYTGHWFIYVKAGTYYDKVTLPAGKINVVLVGEDKNTTILTYDDYAGNNRTTHGVLSNGTNTSYSVAIDASDFQAQNITFQNTATTAQAVALRTNGDRQSYYNCRMVGFQDTYYTQGGLTGPDRIYNKNCYVEGSVDFIFGRDVALFDSCTVYCNREGGTLTAAATEMGYTYGYVFKDCTIGSLAAGAIGFDGRPMVSFFLGRPWLSYPQTAFLNCYEPATLNAAGWTLMGPNPVLYTEYGCSGPGALTTRPVIWTGTSQPSAITALQAADYTIANIFSKKNAGSGFSYAGNWTPALIPYSTGPVSVSSTVVIPKEFSVSQNYPNPFNPSTSISFSLPKSARVTLSVYNTLGQKVMTLVDDYMEAGTYERNFNAGSLASGTYMYQLRAGNAIITKKMLLLK